MKTVKPQKTFIVAVISTAFILFGLSVVKASAAPTEASSPAQPATEQPLPTITSTPAIEPQDDFVEKKSEGLRCFDFSPCKFKNPFFLKHF